MTKKDSAVTIVLATNNSHKVGEIRAILKAARLKVRLKTLADYPPRRPVVENRKTIEGNAAKKAKEIAAFTNEMALADDTGLFIKSLRGAPGVYSARFAGRQCSFLDNNKKVLRLMRNVKGKKRSALFRSIAALALPTGKTFLAEGSIAGFIAHEMRGKTGFGYDPVFYVPKYRKTFAEMGPALKNRISHRALAFKQVPRLIKGALKGLK